MERKFLLELEDYLARHWENILNDVEVDLDSNYAMLEESIFAESSVTDPALTKNAPEISLKEYPPHAFISFQRAIPTSKEQQVSDEIMKFQKSAPTSKEQQDMEDYIRRAKSTETFSTKLLSYIDLSGVSDSEIYKKAGIDRRHFSKIRSNREYQPGKQTVMALCLALKLKLEQMEELLKLAGFSLSNSDTGDLIIRFCVEKGKYDLMEVNEALEYFGAKVLGVS